jgi:hypothetical protein
MEASLTKNSGKKLKNVIVDCLRKVFQYLDKLESADHKKKIRFILSFMTRNPDLKGRIPKSGRIDNLQAQIESTEGFLVEKFLTYHGASFQEFSNSGQTENFVGF